MSRALRLLLAGTVLSVALGACGGDGRSPGDVEVVEPRLVKKPSGQRAFTGFLVNHRSDTLSIAQIEVALYDEAGAEVETVQFEVEDIPASDSVRFTHPIDSDRPFQSAQVQSILTP